MKTGKEDDGGTVPIMHIVGSYGPPHAKYFSGSSSLASIHTCKYLPFFTHLLYHVVTNIYTYHFHTYI